VWGLDVRGLHDRWWASHGVQVVRWGGGRVDAKGPGLYLLLDPDDLVSLPLGRAVRELNWMKPRLLRVRVSDRSTEPYVERVVSDGEGRFVEVQRRYRARTRTTRRVALTGEARLARLWAQAPSRRSARAATEGAAGRERVGALSVHGRVFDAADREQGDACLLHLLEKWRSPSGALDGVYEFQPGVWLHESVDVAGGARFVPPVWVGAGVRLEPGSVVVGPRIVCDEGESAPALPVDWQAMHIPGWRLAPRWRRRRRLVKRLFDFGFSACVLAATLPLYPIIIAAILIEDGRPVFFAHRRQTLRGREFPCLKFRTMRQDAESMKEELAAANVCDGPQFFIENDPRILKVGKFLREHQLDELPQFINVLLGHMSVVGPRPSPDSENQYCPAWREARLSVRPGVTGLWQISRTRQPETDFQEWIRYDLEYVQHAGLRLDLWIIWRTITKVLRG